jgi:hypothetical protein
VPVVVAPVAPASVSPDAIVPPAAAAPAEAPPEAQSVVLVEPHGSTPRRVHTDVPAEPAHSPVTPPAPPSSGGEPLLPPLPPLPLQLPPAPTTSGGTGGCGGPGFGDGLQRGTSGPAAAVIETTAVTSMALNDAECTAPAKGSPASAANDPSTRPD